MDKRLSWLGSIGCAVISQELLHSQILMQDHAQCRKKIITRTVNNVFAHGYKVHLKTSRCRNVADSEMCAKSAGTPTLMQLTTDQGELEFRHHLIPFRQLRTSLRRELAMLSTQRLCHRW